MKHGRLRPLVARAVVLLLPVLSALGCRVEGEMQEIGTSPAQHAAPPAQTEVLVYFTQDEQPVAVERRVPAEAPLRGALEALLAGPRGEERARGIRSWFGEATAEMLRAVSMDDAGSVVVDFADLSAAIPNASTSAGSALLLDELNHTVFQFPEVAEVEYRLEGSCDAFWSWLQRACQTVRRGQHLGL